MKPIPLKILNQDCTHKRVTKDDWQAETTVSYTLENVYIEPSNSLVKTKENTEVVASSMLFYDMVNSKCKLVDVEAVIIFNYDDIITFNSIDYRIIKIDPIYQADLTTIHHYELYLR